ncbi:MAG: ACP S-malonyltransferase [Verrucomicrobiota bacterium]
MSSTRVVLLFAGQGAQEVGMGKDLLAYDRARELFAKADELVGFGLSEVMFEGPLEELTRTSRCQPALYVHGCACLELLRERVPGLDVSAAAGLSLGEFTAHAAAKTFDFDTGLMLVYRRGVFMEEGPNGGSMAAMVGGTEEAVYRLAEEVGVDVANYNAPGQIVLSGPKTGIERSVQLAKERGIKMAKELVVAGAYHSRLMQPAQDKLSVELANAVIGEPRYPVWCNVEARPVAGVAHVRKTLEAQVTGSVRWSESMQKLIAGGETTFVEIGPKGVLAGLMKRIDRSVRVIRVHDETSLESAVTALGA